MNFHQKLVCVLYIGLLWDIMPVNNLAIAGNVFLFIEVLEKFQVVYGTFWIELFLA